MKRDTIDESSSFGVQGISYVVEVVLIGRDIATAWRLNLWFGYNFIF